MIFWNFCWRAGRKREARVTVRIRVRVLFETKICLALKIQILLASHEIVGVPKLIKTIDIMNIVKYLFSLLCVK